jgi:trk system potassium uptake protein TrkH
LVVGFAGYVLVGTLLLCLPWAQARPLPVIDHAFNVVSAVSTTGLTTVAVTEGYTRFGQGVLLVLFQLGGVGFMTLSSVLIVARGRPLSPGRLGVLHAGFALPHYFRMRDFLVQVVWFTFACEAVGTLVLWWQFRALGVESPLWSALFHAVSAFATAGFSLNPDSLEGFAKDPWVCLTIGALCYAGGLGFIVVQDVWYSVRLRERMLTLTSKTILWMTGAVFAVGTPLLILFDPGVRERPLFEAVLVGGFQVASASTTAGFNSVPIGAMAPAALVVVMGAMVIGASPSGTGGGIKTTSLSALLATLVSVLRGRQTVAWLGYEVPVPRVLTAFAASTLYAVLLVVGVLLLCVTEAKPFLPLVFEAASAIGTVGLSMGITGDLTFAGKCVVIALMFAGRCGPLTLGFALLAPQGPEALKPDDLAV